VPEPAGTEGSAGIHSGSIRKERSRCCRSL